MSPAKDVMIDIITQQPEDSTYNEILRELAHARMVQRGLSDSDSGRTLSDSEVGERIKLWQKYGGPWRPLTVSNKSTITLLVTIPRQRTKL